MNLAILRGSRSGDVDLLARGRAIRGGQLQRLGINQNGLDSFRRVEILDVTIARKQSGGLHELRKDWSGAGAAGQGLSRELSSKPIQMTQTRFEVNPANQPSREVPVLPAAGSVNPRGAHAGGGAAIQDVFQGRW